MSKIRASIVCAAAIAAFSSSGRSATIAFDNSGDLSTNFSINGTAGYYVQQSNGGIGDSGSVLPNQSAGNATAILQTDVFDGTSSNTITLSMFVKWENSTQLNDALELGIVGNTTDKLMTVSGFSHSAAGNPNLTVALFPQSTGGVTSNFATLGLRNETIGTSNAGFNNVNTFTLQVGNFYKVIASFQKLSNNQFNVTAAIEDWGTDGTAKVGDIASGSRFDGLTQNSFLGTDTTLFAGFRSNTGGGAGALDNYTVVPEPSTVALLSIGLLLLHCRSTRRRAT
jgi:hypothetical protein